MIKVINKLAAVLLVAVMTMTFFVGCAKEEAEPLDPTEVVMVVGDTEVTLGFANFYVRYNQSLMESVYESYMGDEAWEMEIAEGYTYEDSLKDSMIEELQELYLVVNHAADYQITLTDEENAAIAAVADDFLSENTDTETLEKISGDRDTVIEYLTLYTMKQKVSEAIKADIDTTVNEEEIAQKKARYYKISTYEELDDGTTMSMSEEELKTARKQAKEFLAGAKENGDMETYAKEKSLSTSTFAFNTSSTTMDASLIEAADALEEGEFSEVIEVEEDGIYVLQLVSLYDAEATETAREKLLSERGDEHYTELLEKWEEETEITVNDDVWAKISLQDLKIVYIYDEEDEEEEEDEE